MFPATEAYLSQLDALKILVSLKQIFHHSKRSFLWSGSNLVSVLL